MARFIFSTETDQVIGKLGWGSDIASRSSCGSGWHLLATAWHRAERSVRCARCGEPVAERVLDVVGSLRQCRGIDDWSTIATE